MGSARPASVEEVRAVLRAASRWGVPVFPVSAGKNWGYGDACAPADGMLILDLSRMDRILEVNADLAYAVIEPGVTQGRLEACLRERRLPLMLDGNGAGPQASFVGNILERGFGNSRYGDRCSHCCAIEAVLADGQVVRTGFSAYPKARAAHVHKHGVGPSLDGILTQSNLAVVTRLTVWLQPKPERMAFFFISLDDARAIGPLMERLRGLLLAGTLRTIVHGYNDRRALAAETRFPWDRADGKQALEIGHPELFRELLREHEVFPWVASGSLSGGAAEVRAGRTALRRALRGLPGLRSLSFVGERRLRVIERIAGLCRRLPSLRAGTKRLERMLLACQVLEGRPSYRTLAGAHWRSRGRPGPQNDPLDSGSGLIWVSPVLPMTAPAIDAVLSLSEPIFHEFGFEFQVTLSCLNGRALCAVMSICYDRGSIEERRRAESCEERLMSRLMEEGFYPYRASARQQEMLRRVSPAAWEAARRLKKAWDPGGVLAPGHYIPSV